MMNNPEPYFGDDIFETNSRWRTNDQPKGGAVFVLSESGNMYTLCHLAGTNRFRIIISSSVEDIYGEDGCNEWLDNNPPVEISGIFTSRHLGVAGFVPIKERGHHFRGFDFGWAADTWAEFECEHMTLDIESGEEGVDRAILLMDVSIIAKTRGRDGNLTDDSTVTFCAGLTLMRILE